MKRLTERSENGTAVYRHPTPEPEGWKTNRASVLERCCQYEDTGLEPEEVDELKEKQRPKEVQNMYPGEIRETGVHIMMGDCPVCASPVPAEQRYCWNCGQMLDWSED